MTSSNAQAGNVSNQFPQPRPDIAERLRTICSNPWRVSSRKAHQLLTVARGTQYELIVQLIVERLLQGDYAAVKRVGEIFTSSLRILITTEHYSKRNETGVLRYVREVEEWLKSNGYSVTVVVPSREKQVDEGWIGLPTLPRTPFSPYRLAVPGTDVKELLSSLRPNIILHMDALTMAFNFVRAAKDLHIPILTRYCTDMEFFANTHVPRPLRKLSIWSIRGLMRYTFSRSDGIIVPRPSLVGDVHSLYASSQPLMPIFIIPRGVNTNVFKPLPDIQRSTLLYVGRLSKEKNLDLIIDALSLLPSHYSVVFAGDGPYKEQLIARAKHRGVYERCHFLGFLNDEALVREYNRALALIVPSSFDTQGPILEANACGVPAIVPPSGLRDFVTRDSGVLFYYPTAFSLAYAVMRVNGNEHSRYSKGALKFSQQFTLDTTCNLLVEACLITSALKILREKGTET